MKYLLTAYLISETFVVVVTSVTVSPESGDPRVTGVSTPTCPTDIIQWEQWDGFPPVPSIIFSGSDRTWNTKVYIIRMDFLTVELRAQDQSFSIIYY